jgi:hypothetical protein
VGDEPVEPTVQEHTADVHHHPGAGSTRTHLATTPKRSAEVPSYKRHDRDGSADPPGSSHHGSQVRVGGHHNGVVGNRA